MTLLNHPHLGRSKDKELYFFNNDGNYRKVMEWYAEQFKEAEDDVRLFETTPAYFSCWKTPARIARHMSDLKLIGIMRDPVVRFIPHYLHFRALNIIHANPERRERFSRDKPFLETIRFNGIDQSVAEVIKQYDLNKQDQAGFFDRGQYLLHIATWRAHVADSLLLLLKFNELIATPTSSLFRLQSFTEAPLKPPQLISTNETQRGWNTVQNTQI